MGAFGRCLRSRLDWGTHDDDENVMEQDTNTANILAQSDQCHSYTGP